MKLRTVRKLYFAALLALLLVAVIGKSWPVAVYCGILCCGMIPFLVLIYNYWRCPACGKGLGRMVIGDTARCPHCRKKIKL